MASTAVVRYSINAAAEVLVEVSLDVDESASLSELPRFGTNLVLPLELDNVSYYGRGPNENYWDRKESAFVGLYESKVADLGFAYIRPQENGNRSDVRWVSFANSDGSGLRFTGEPLVYFSAHHQTIDDFDPGLAKQQRHYTEIVDRDFVSVNIDYKQTGVGGDNSWGARTHAQYTLHPKDYSYSFIIQPLSTHMDK